MYNSADAKKSFAQLFQENGKSAAFKSFVFVISWYCVNKYILNVITPTLVFVIGYVIFAAYFTWKVKLIRVLRGWLRGYEYRDRND